MNRLQEFLQGQDESTVKDVAEYGIECVAIEELIYTEDIVAFFDRYYNDIEAVITEHLEGVTGVQYFDLLNCELMRDLENYLNVAFAEEDTYLNIMLDKSEQLAEEDNEDWHELTGVEQEELIIDYMEDVVIDIQDTDKINFVCLAVEIVAQDMQEG